MLARIEKLDGVLDAWTDKSGTRIVASHAATASPAEAIALVSSALAPRGVKAVSGPEAESAVRECQSGAPGWFRAKETIALSTEEAQILAARSAARAAEKAGLEPAQREAFEKWTREALVRVFEEQHQRDAFDGRSLNAKICAEVDKVVDELELSPEQRKRLREAIDEEQRRPARPSKDERGKSP